MDSLPDDHHLLSDDPARALALFRELRDMVEAIAAHGAAGYSTANAILYSRSVHEYHRLLRDAPIFSDVRAYGCPLPRMLHHVFGGAGTGGNPTPPWSEDHWRMFRAGTKTTEARILAALAAASVDVDALAVANPTTGPAKPNRAQQRRHARREKARELRHHSHLTRKEIAARMGVSVRTIDGYLADLSD